MGCRILEALAQAIVEIHSHSLGASRALGTLALRQRGTGREHEDWAQKSRGVQNPRAPSRGTDLGLNSWGRHLIQVMIWVGGWMVKHLRASVSPIVRQAQLLFNPRVEKMKELANHIQMPSLPSWRLLLISAVNCLPLNCILFCSHPHAYQLENTSDYNIWRSRV